MPEFNLDEFRGVTRLFPLQGMVMFPHAVVPLHVFESRYRQMTSDALATDRLITLIQPTSELIPTPRGPLLESVGCIGRIIQHERLDDGRYNFLLAGIKRVRIVAEINTPGKLYREAEAELLLENNLEAVTPESFQEMVGRFATILNEADPNHPGDTEIRRILKTSRNPALVSDLISQAITLPASIKQMILGMTDVHFRVNYLIEILRMMTDPNIAEKAKEVSFPPKFSVN
ncbi:MAG: LON peptidase substrate-binding domain-containing protein [Isosphaeraceae bacterium]